VHGHLYEYDAGKIYIIYFNHVILFLFSSFLPYRAHLWAGLAIATLFGGSIAMCLIVVFQWFYLSPYAAASSIYVKVTGKPTLPEVAN